MRAQKDIPKYMIFGVCNPHMGHAVLSADWNAGMLLPCTCFLRQGDAATKFVAGAVDATRTVGQQREGVSALAETAAEAVSKFRSVFEALRS